MRRYGCLLGFAYAETHTNAYKLADAKNRRCICLTMWANANGQIMSKSYIFVQTNVLNSEMDAQNALLLYTHNLHYICACVCRAHFAVCYSIGAALIDWATIGIIIIVRIHQQLYSNLVNCNGYMFSIPNRKRQWPPFRIVYWNISFTCVYISVAERAATSNSANDRIQVSVE